MLAAPVLINNSRKHLISVPDEQDEVVSIIHPA
jgi:hypothetical protein